MGAEGQPGRRLADYALALDMMSRMGELATEDAAVERIFDVFAELCAPESLSYLPLRDGAGAALHCRPSDGSACTELMERVPSMVAEWAWTVSGKGFLLRLHRDGEPLGVLEVEGIALPEHRKHYLNLALAIQGVLGLAVTNARNYEALERTRREMQEERDALRTYLELSEAVNRIDVTVSSTLDFDEIVRRVLRDASEALGADSAGLLERRDGGWFVRQAYGTAREMVGRIMRDEEMVLASRAAAERRTVVSNDARAEAVPPPDPVRETRSSISSPLFVKDELIGLLVFGSPRLDAFSEALADFASKIAATVSLALENARLFEAKRSVADTLQEALLEMPERVAGVTFGHRYRSATLVPAEVGGDFYELFELPDGNIGVLIGDVSGKGVVAAKTTSLLKDTIRAFAQLSDSPALILERTNALVLRMSAVEVFATLFFGLLDPASGALTYCSAGHPRAVVRRPDGAVVTLEETSPLLGAFPDVAFDDATTVLSAEDILVLYTDGALDARRDGQFFGEGRLRRAVSQGPGEPDALAAYLLQSVEDFSRGVFADDLALLTVRLERSG